MSELILKILPVGLREYMNAFNLDDLEEIRLRANRNVILDYGKKKGHFVTDYVISSCQIMEALEYISTFSLYAYEDDIRQGFITIKGGHRVGIAGKVVLENKKIKKSKFGTTRVGAHIAKVLPTSIASLIVFFSV